MSGIFGVLGAVTAAELEEMGRRLKHRGTHLRWWRVADNVHLGAVSRTPPVLHSAGSFSAVIDQPDTLGVAIDARDMVQRYASRGVRDLDQPGAAFAMAAWQADAQMLHLGRDLAGQRPLFIAELEDGIAFASEYKCLLALQAVQPTVDRDAIQYLQVWKLAPPGAPFA